MYSYVTPTKDGQVRVHQLCQKYIVSAHVQLIIEAAQLEFKFIYVDS